MALELPPGRYWATIAIGGLTDTNATIGYDELMQTYFFQSGLEDHETGEPLHWFGRKRGEFTSFAMLKQYMEQFGMQILEWELGE